MGASAPRRERNIFKETDIYTIEKADGTRDLHLEHGWGDSRTGSLGFCATESVSSSS